MTTKSIVLLCAAALCAVQASAEPTQTEDSLLAAPVSRATKNPTPEPTPVAEKFALKLVPGDGNLRQSLNNWLHARGYQDIAWQLPKDIPVERFHEFDGTSVKAVLTDVARTYKGTPRSMRFCIHTNKVVRAIPVTQFCNPEAL